MNNVEDENVTENVVKNSSTVTKAENLTKKDVLKRFSKQQLLPFNDVAAFAMDNGNVKDILDYDFKMILSDALDGASESIANDYDYLLGV